MSRTQITSELFSPVLVHEYLTLSANKFPDKPALLFNSEIYSYKKLDELTDNLAFSLIGLGVKRHDRVIIFGDNSAEVVIALYAVLKTGASFVLLNGSLKAPKLHFIIKDSSPSVIIADIKNSEVVRSTLEKIKSVPEVIWFGDTSDNNTESKNKWRDLITDTDVNQKITLESRKRSVIDYDLSTLIYTSGSTGEPKGVMSSHNNMISAARSIISYIKNTPDDIVLTVLPLSFDYGLYQVIMCFMYGGTIVLERSMLFPLELIKKIESKKVTGFPIVPTLLVMLLKMETLKNYDLSSLRYISNTGAALPVEHIKAFRKLFHTVQIFSMFGLTECKRIAYLPPEDIDRKPGSVGKAMPNCEVFIVNENREFVKPNEIGELVVRGTNVMRGYWNSQDLSEKVYKDGWFHREKLLYTGDFFYQDEEGYLYFVGRKDDMIKTKGERVSPKELENILCSADGISEAAVIGVPDEILGQAIKAFIVKTPGSIITEKDVLRYCSRNVEIFMIPKYVVFIESLPKSPNGKIDKKILKQME
ncbi:MAG: acyl--CoA ligase [Ignavibacterium sp.]|nr:acyl--CoA ligase [Ignavibacterium sp.]